MIEVRTFAQLSGANCEWLNAKPHLSFVSNYEIKGSSWDRCISGTCWGTRPFPRGELVGLAAGPRAH